MARVRNTMKVIEQYSKSIDSKYGMGNDNMIDIREVSNGPYDLICNGFRFGYVQGLKAARAAESRKAVK